MLIISFFYNIWWNQRQKAANLAHFKRMMAALDGLYTETPEEAAINLIESRVSAAVLDDLKDGTPIKAIHLNPKFLRRQMEVKNIRHRRLGYPLMTGNAVSFMGFPIIESERVDFGGYLIEIGCKDD